MSAHASTIIAREIVFDGDAKTRELRPLRAPGQLWERVGEAATDYSARSRFRYAGREAGLWGTTARDCATPATFGRIASGIIRAGERIK